MDFGVATEFYPDEFGYHNDFHFTPQASPDLLSVIQKLHASLDPRTVFACYGKVLGQYLPVLGIELHLQQHTFYWGKRQGISLQRQIRNDINSAEICYRLTAPLTPSQLSLFNELEPLLIQPLFNAVKYLDMSQQAMFDALTHLGNRHYYGQSVKNQIARCHRTGDDLTLVILDLDNFKQLNDRFGHKFGDTILSEFGQLISKVIRNADQAFRIGGDEFLILAQGNTRCAAVLCQRILDAMSEHNLFAQFAVQTSIGMSQLAREQNEEQLYEVADKALYQAKAAGRNCFKVA